MATRKRGKRGNGEGTIVRRKDGRYMCQLSFGRDPVTGKLRRISLYGKTRQEVAAQLSKALSDRDRGTLVAPHKLTLGTWLDIWLNDYKKPSVRPATFDFYESISRVHIKPALGHLTLTGLRPEHVQRLYNDKAASGLSVSTVRYVHITLHAAVKQAMKNQLVTRNVSEATTLPQGKSAEMTPLTRDQLNQFLISIQGERLYPALLLMVMTGCRRGELLGIRWEDVDLDVGVWRVKRAHSTVRNHDSSGDTPKTRLISQEPKTDKSKRNLPLAPEVIDALRRLKATQAQERLLLGEAFVDRGLVFCYPDGSPLIGRTVLQQFQRLLQRAGLPKVRLHDLRHSFATMMLELGEHPKTVQTLLGHSKIATTLDIYSHVTDETATKAVSALSAAINGVR